MHYPILFYMRRDFTRRSFVASLTASAASLVLAPRAVKAGQTHPVPRPGITGKYVLKHKDLERYKKLIPLFDSVRDMPQIFDGIHCSCGCTRPIDYYSLLSCFEGAGMARECSTCQDEARLVIKLHKQGKTLAQIRAAYDREFA